MCVIMCKAAGLDFPPVDEIKNCCDANPDGFGAMWSDGRNVRMFKTMAKEAFIQWYEMFVKTYPTTVPLVIHARIATHGSKNINNCHPWLDTNGNIGKIGFCHNGVLSIKNRADMTDSETFFRDIWLPAYKMGGTKYRDNATQAVIGTSRFCFLYAKGNVERWGNWEEGSVKGVFYTNSSWKKNRWEGIGYNHGGGYYGGGYYGNGCRYYDDDDLYPSYYGNGQGNQAGATTTNTPVILKSDTPAEKEAKRKVEWIMKQPNINAISLLFYREWKSRTSTLVRGKTFQDALLKEAMWAPHRCPLWNLFNFSAKDFEGGKPKDANTAMVTSIIEKFNIEFHLTSIKGILSMGMC